VAILPIITLALIGLHLLMVQYHGMSVPLSLENKKLRQVPFFPNVFYKDLMIWLIVLGGVVTLAVFLPPEIGVKADPLAPPPENIKPEWYFLFLLETLKLFPGSIAGLNGETIAILVVSCVILFFFLIPFVDRKSARGEKSTLFTWIGLFYLLYFLTMTVVGFLS
jgi:cytochrome b6